MAANHGALRLDPQHVAARRNLWAAVNNAALALCGAGRFAEAAALTARGRSAAPDHAALKNNEVYILQQWVAALCRRHRYTEALVALDAAHARRPDEPYFARA